MQRGYIKLFRKLQDNVLWTGEPFTRGQAWVDLLLLASHKDTAFYKRGIKVKQQRGIVGWSVLGLADRWHWSRGKVQRFLDELETVQQIEQQKNRVTTLIKIVNYEEYQGNDTTNRTTDGQQTDNRRTQYKNVKNVKNVKKENIRLPDWLDKTLWADFKKHRTGLKAKMTPRAEELTIAKLEKLKDEGYSPNAVIERSIENGWKGVFPIKDKPQRGKIDWEAVNAAKGFYDVD